jgi:hypothetical protein
VIAKRGLFVITGGACEDHNSEHTGKELSQYQILPFEIKNEREALTGKMKACAKQLGGCWAKHPRQRHLSVTDNERYVYLIGS